MYHRLIKPILFLFSPERAHSLTVSLFRILMRIPGIGHLYRWLLAFEDQDLQRTCFGLTFKNPVGLAAGFDKDGKYFRDMAHLGFGFLELGTVTPRPQTGNPKPRLFRLADDEALINRMGFNNDGVEALANRLEAGSRPEGVIIGGNIGKNKDTPNEGAIDDYLFCFQRLFSAVDYFVVNVSSPNTPGLRSLQEKEPLSRLLQKLQEENNQREAPKPILLKIAPDLNNAQLDDIIDIVQDCGIAGIIATNTTISREGLIEEQGMLDKIGGGGLSGAPLKERSTEVISYIHRKTSGNIPIIGVGGISSPDDAIEKLEAGASLVQVYSGLIYQGPFFIKHLKKGILKHGQTH